MSDSYQNYRFSSGGTASMLQHTHKKQQHTNSPPGRLTEESIRIESSLENVSTFQRFWPTWVMILQMQLYFFVLVCFCKLFHTKNYCVSEWGQHCNTHYDEKLSDSHCNKWRGRLSKQITCTYRCIRLVRDLETLIV